MSDKTPEEQIEALKLANKGLLDDLAPLKELKKSIDAFGGFESLKTTIESSSELKKKLEETSTNVEVVRTTLNKKVADAEKRYTDLKAKLANSKLEGILKSAVTEAGAEWDLISHKVKERVKHTVNDETDEVTVEVLDDKGQPMSAGGKAAGLSDLLNEFKSHATFGKAFGVINNTSKSGAGVTNGGGKPLNNGKNPFIGGSVDEQTALWRTNQPLARRLQAEAQGVKA